MAQEEIPDGLIVVNFKFIGQPVPKARARVVRDRRSGVVRSYTPDATKNYEQTVAWYAKEAMGGRQLARGPLALYVTLGMQIPNSWSQKRKLEAATGHIAPTKKPDVSNIVKGIEDAMNSVVYHDDGQIVEHIIRKQYCMEPHAQITIIELDAKPAPK